MSEFARRSPLPAINLAIKNDPCAHAFSNEHEYEISRIAHLGQAKPKFAKRNCVSIVIDEDR